MGCHVLYEKIIKTDFGIITLVSDVAILSVLSIVSVVPLSMVLFTRPRIFKVKVNLFPGLV